MLIQKLLSAFFITGTVLSSVQAQQASLPAYKADYTVPAAYAVQLPENDRLTGYLGMRYDYNLNNRLLKIDEKGILEGFQARPGKQRWIGEHVGKYLETAANTWMITRNAALKTQMDRIFNELIKTQLADGYLGTYLPDSYWTSWDVWVHKYDLFGLLAYYRVTGNQRALDAAIKVGNLLLKNFGDAPGQKDIIKAGSHVGMAATSVIDPMADLYMWTGDRRYLDFCRYIIKSYEHEGGPSIIKTLLKEKRVDKVANAKAYEMMSNLVGVVKLYRLTGDDEYLKAAQYAVADVTSKRLFVTGTTSDHEHFIPDYLLQADTAAHMGEGCVTTTWIQLNMQLFAISGDLKYYNEMEKAVYNHLLGAENPETGCVSYYTPLIGVKPYRCNITCCLSSVPRGIALIPYLNYGKLNNQPTVLMYEAADIKDQVQTTNGNTIPLAIQIRSGFPANGKASIQVQLQAAARFALQLRVPVWATKFKATVGGKTYTGKADELITIDRNWSRENTIAVSFEIPVTILPGGQSYPDFIAIKRGPQVLSVDQSLNPSFDIRKAAFQAPSALQLTDAAAKLPAQWIGRQAYIARLKTASNKTQPVVLVPYAEASQTGGDASVWIPAAK
ncbi:glycoside hydrolase family 127 protein [Niabella sp. CC-SYL272]|uniref:beta-L-arabinofuranosidase domain-containing protein n=1 Tax=Niabella agricola TaxID=2891571 RepID=UPI001F4230D2|nr:beta-L-arabinofuranosidase domain-containing protein [Niabella agricola]MCF3111762.1 glycoside hydrolase family 127 protein [Niabella agricola]